MQRKTLTERLTNKYQLIVRNEENFADRWTFSFNFARLLVVLVVLVLLFYGLVTGINFLGSYILGIGDSEETQQLVTLAAKVDSLEYETNVKDQYILSFKTMLEGGEPRRMDSSSQKIENAPEAKISKEEETFRKKFEKENDYPYYNSKDGFTPLYFFTPVSGKTSDMVQSGKIIGLTITANKTKPVKSLEDGIVVLSSRNADSTYKLVLQHQSGLLTIYDQIKSPLVKTGTIVLKAADIASPAEQKVIFTMIYNGKFLNPRLYIAWDK
jgi:hypothetical protein